MLFRLSPRDVIGHGRRAAADVLTCLRFFTRLPVPPLAFEPPWEAARFGAALRMAPVAGLAVGAIAALVLSLGVARLGLPHGVAAALAVAAQIAVSGALHEDGLADVADGFGGGANPARKLDIMRDSRLGTFGVLALVLSVTLRIAAVSALIDRYGLMAAAAVLPAAAAASRGFCLIPLGILRPARHDGLAHAAGILPPAALPTAMGLAVFTGMTLASLGGFGETRGLGACAASIAASMAMTFLAHRQIGGQTGDVAGGTQQAAELAYLLALLVAPSLG